MRERSSDRFCKPCQLHRIMLRAAVSALSAISMTGDTSDDLRDLIDRVARGDLAARRELLHRAHDRLLRIAAVIFKEDFPGLHGRHDLESVVSEVWMRLLGALETTQPQTVEGFFGLVFTKVRQVLLDMARRQRRDDAHRNRKQPDESAEPALAREPADTSNEPAKLAMLTEFHQQVETLPVDLRTVFELRYYGGYSQAEIAQILSVHPKQVSRRWLAATGRLSRWLKGFAELA
jgi:RNA polymerase sigma factor (sigma-70 family)